MNFANITSFADLGIKLDNSSQLISNPTAMFPLSSISAAGLSQTQSIARPTLMSGTNPLPNGSSSTSLNGVANNANLLAATTSAMLQSLPQSSNLDKKTRERVNYLQQLLKDKKQCQLYPSIFLHVERLLDEGRFFRVLLNTAKDLNLMH